MNIVRKINYIEAKEIIRQHGYLIDVRSAEEYKRFHLPNSISMPLEEIYDEYEKYLPDKNTPVIVYCATGTRSRIATVFFNDLGYKYIFDLGGICRR
ncbi:MAG: rhodanese-like domain-containing protein [Bacillota bacterium]|jgi:phage shock protein E